MTENRAGTLDNATVGALPVDVPRAVFYRHGTGRDREAWGIRIGNGFLQDCVVTIDDRAERVTPLRPADE